MWTVKWRQDAMMSSGNKNVPQNVGCILIMWAWLTLWQETIWSHKLAIYKSLSLSFSNVSMADSVTKDNVGHNLWIYTTHSLTQSLSTVPSLPSKPLHFAIMLGKGNLTMMQIPRLPHKFISANACQDTLNIHSEMLRCGKTAKLHTGLFIYVFTYILSKSSA